MFLRYLYLAPHKHLLTTCIWSRQGSYFQLTNQRQVFQILRYYAENFCQIDQNMCTIYNWLECLANDWTVKNEGSWLLDMNVNTECG